MFLKVENIFYLFFHSDHANVDIAMALLRGRKLGKNFINFVGEEMEARGKGTGTGWNNIVWQYSKIGSIIGGRNFRKKLACSLLLKVRLEIGVDGVRDAGVIAVLVW